MILEHILKRWRTKLVAKKVNDMGQTRMMIAYLAEAKAAMLTHAAKHPERTDYAEGAHYIELLAEAATEMLISAKPLRFTPRDLGL